MFGTSTTYPTSNSWIGVHEITGCYRLAQLTHKTNHRRNERVKRELETIMEVALLRSEEAK